MTRVETSPASWRRLGALGSASALVTIATVAVNGLAYLPPVIGARLLSPSDFGALATLLAIGAIVSVPGLGLQLASAVRWARQDSVPGAGRVALVMAATTSGLLVLATPLLSVALDLPAIQPILVALLTFPVVGAGFWLGELQGRERFGRVALGLVILAIARFGGLVVALEVGLGVTGALAVGAVGAWLAVGLLGWLAHSARAAAQPHGGGEHPAELSPYGEPAAQPVFGEPAASRLAGGQRLTPGDVLGAATATLAMLAVSYADLILARAVLPPDIGGAYAVGSVLTKGALWAPGVVTVLALPRLAKGSRRALSIALGCVAAFGLVLVAASALFGGFAMRLAGGPTYVHLGGYAAGFAVVGALYALVYVLVNAEIADGARWPAVPLWAALVGIAAAMIFIRPAGLGGVLLISVCTAAGATLAMAAVLAARRRDASRPASR